MRTTKTTSSVQLSLFPCQGTGVKDTQNGNTPIAKYPTVSEYLKTREALFRLLASYPPTMPVKEAVRRARVDFAKSESKKDRQKFIAYRVTLTELIVHRPMPEPGRFAETDCYIKGVLYKKGSFIPSRKEASHDQNR